MKEIDIRVVKTIEGIHEGFLLCLEEVGFQNMTVKNITEKARINRSTFYAHFTDKYDLRDKYMDGMLKDYVVNLDTNFIQKTEITMDSYFSELKRCLQAFLKKKREYLILWNANLLDRNFFQEMINSGIEKLVEGFRQAPDIPKEKEQFYSLYANLFLGNMMVSVRWWFEKGQNIDIDTYTRMMIKHMSEGIFHTLKHL
ncbi:MAG TPA: TetR/AcrR family transcriptional regulator [Clostridiales bacterium]|nr:TetR/AcrR family transcriptional regulator [Clostridiales bacterium]